MICSFFSSVSAADVLFGEPVRKFSPVINANGNTGREFPGVLRQNEKSSLDTENPDVTLRSPVDPSSAMYHSLFIPGWGQLDNGKKKKAALFFIAEMVCIGGYLYVDHEIRTGDYTDFRKDNLRHDRNSFILYYMISKVFGMLDAYVDAHLENYDVEDITPADLKKE